MAEVKKNITPLYKQPNQEALKAFVEEKIEKINHQNVKGCLVISGKDLVVVTSGPGILGERDGTDEVIVVVSFGACVPGPGLNGGFLPVSNCPRGDPELPGDFSLRVCPGFDHVEGVNLSQVATPWSSFLGTWLITN